MDFTFQYHQLLFLLALAFLTRLLRIKNSNSEIAAQEITPMDIERMPLSILPMIPKNAIKPTVERSAFSIAIAAVQVKKEIIAQMKEMILSPMVILRG